MYYKVMHNNRVIDILDNPVYIRYDKRHDSVVVTDRDHAEGFLSSDRIHCWRVVSMKDNGGHFEIVEVAQIDKYEYEQLKIFGMKSPQDIIDAYTLTLIEGGIL